MSDIRRDDSAAANLFRIEGEYWTIVFDGQVFRLRDTRGLRYLAHLLAHPTTRVAAVDLVAIAHRPRPPREAANPQERARDDDTQPLGTVPLGRERARVTVTKGIKAALQRIAAAHPTLACHLEVTIKRGYVCSYNPDPRVCIQWDT